MRKLFVLLSLLLLLPLEGLPCTTAVISGRYTKSGRPMLWKVRDTSEYRNHMRRFESPIGYYVGLINDTDPEGTQVWGGHNSRGFGIMNSAATNVNANDTTSFKDQEGVVMKLALERCETLADFEVLLNELPKPMGLASHFGVVDAYGGAAFYEVNNYTWTRFDADDTEHGYILRTNYSATGDLLKGYGYVRMLSTESHFNEIEEGTLTVEMLGSQLSRSLRHTLLGVDFKDLGREGALLGGKGYVNTDDMITRYATSSMILIEGVQPGGDLDDMTSWVQIAQPFVSPLIPVWTWNEVPVALQLPSDDIEEKTLSQLAMEAKEKLYPLVTVEKARYLYLPFIYNKENKGVAQQFELMERIAIPEVGKAKDKQQLELVQARMIEKGREVLKRALAE